MAIEKTDIKTITKIEKTDWFLRSNMGRLRFNKDNILTGMQLDHDYELFKQYITDAWKALAGNNETYFIFDDETKCVTVSHGGKAIYEVSEFLEGINRKLPEKYHPGEVDLPKEEILHPSPQAQRIMKYVSKRGALRSLIQSLSKNTTNETISVFNHIIDPLLPHLNHIDLSIAPLFTYGTTVGNQFCMRVGSEMYITPSIEFKQWLYSQKENAVSWYQSGWCIERPNMHQFLFHPDDKTLGVKFEFHQYIPNVYTYPGGSTTVTTLHKACTVEEGLNKVKRIPPFVKDTYFSAPLYSCEINAKHFYNNNGAHVYIEPSKESKEFLYSHPIKEAIKYKNGCLFRMNETKFSCNQGDKTEGIIIEFPVNLNSRIPAGLANVYNNSTTLHNTSTLANKDQERSNSLNLKISDFRSILFSKPLNKDVTPMGAASKNPTP